MTLGAAATAASFLPRLPRSAGAAICPPAFGEHGSGRRPAALSAGAGTILRQMRGREPRGWKCSKLFSKEWRAEPVAQSVEHVTFNHGVLGSSPSGLTTKSDES